MTRIFFLLAFGCSSTKDLRSDERSPGDTGSAGSPVEDTVEYLPALEILNPGRGLMLASGEVTMDGTFSPLVDTGVAVFSQGEAAVVTGESFSHDLSLVDGPNVIETLAMVEEQAVAVDHRTVLRGEFEDPGEGLESGFVFHIAPSALDALGLDASRFFRAQDLTEMIENPVLYEVDEICFFMCYTMWGVEMNVDNPAFSDIIAEFHPDDDGMWVSFTMFDFTMDWWGGAVVSEMGHGGSGSIYAETIRVDMYMGLGWSDTLEVDIQSVSVESSGLTIDADDFMFDAMAFFGLSMDGFAASLMENVFASMLVEAVPDAARDALAMAEIYGLVDLMPETLTIRGEVSNVSVSASGVGVEYLTRVETSAVIHNDDHPGRWVSGQSVPALGDSSRVQGGMHLDFVNQVFHGAWAAGALDKAFPGEVLGLTSSVIGRAMPGVGLVEVYTEALLPPVMTPGPGGVGRLTLGDMVLRIVPTGDPVDDAIMTIAINLEADLNLNVDGSYLIPELGNVTASATIAHPAMLTVELQDVIQVAMNAVAQEQMPVLLGAMFKLPLDLIDGYRLVNSTVLTTAEGMFMIEGDLQPVTGSDG